MNCGRPHKTCGDLPRGRTRLIRLMALSVNQSHDRRRSPGLYVDCSSLVRLTGPSACKAFDVMRRRGKVTWEATSFARRTSTDTSINYAARTRRWSPLAGE